MRRVLKVNSITDYILVTYTVASVVCTLTTAAFSQTDAKLSLHLLLFSLSAMMASLLPDELNKYMHYDAAAAKAMGVFPSPGRFQLASALGYGEDASSGSDFSLFSILNNTCTSMGSRMLKRCAILHLCSASSKNVIS